MTQTKSLFISAGHSFTDPGAYGNGVSEADIVLEFRDLVADALRGHVVFTKDGDREENLPLAEAVAMARTRDVAVEFHCNAFSDAGATGVETLSAPQGVALGVELGEAVAVTLGITFRGAKGEDAGPHSRLAFVGQGGGVILELFFITNPDDLQAYRTHKFDLSRVVADVLSEAVSNG